MLNFARATGVKANNELRNGGSERQRWKPSPLPSPWHQSSCEYLSGKETVDMTKTIDTITEIIRNPKHPFRKADDRPAKAQKHRYERRKIKEYIKLGNWAQEAIA
jgi:hypothetical protein